MAKLFRGNSIDFEFKYSVRSRDNITRPRTNKFHDTEFGVERNKDIIEFGKEKYEAQSKSGINRTIEVLKYYEEHIWQMCENDLERR